MSHKSNTWTRFVLMCYLVTASPGEETPKKLIGALGGSVVFKLKTSEEFKFISWIRSDTEAGQFFASATPAKNPREPCDLQILFPEFLGRLNVSQDCKELHLIDLKPADNNTFRAQINPRSNYEKPQTITFSLHVYKNLSDIDVTIQCTRNGSGSWNGNFSLCCSVGDWEYGVKFSWARANMSESSGKTLWIPRDLQDIETNVTCTAENPIDKASRTVSLKTVCAPVQADSPPTGPGTVPATDSGSLGGSSIAGIVIAIVVLVAIVLVAWWCRRTKRTGSHQTHMTSADKSEPKGPGCTIYSVIEGSPAQTPLRSRTNANTKQLQTVYSMVNPLPVRQNLLQTDDEKMRQEAQGDAEKTIYSEVTKFQEDQQRHPQTVYDTVKNPRL